MSILVAVLVAGLMLSTAALTSSLGTYDLSWWTVDGGGGALSIDGGYSLSSTAGQPEVGLLSDGGYTLSGGFWGGGALAEEIYRVYLPLVLRESP
jgi:hypothetical protein